MCCNYGNGSILLKYFLGTLCLSCVGDILKLYFQTFLAHKHKLIAPHSQQRNNNRSRKHIKYNKLGKSGGRKTKRPPTIAGGVSSAPKAALTIPINGDDDTEPMIRQPHSTSKDDHSDDDDIDESEHEETLYAHHT